MKKLLVAMSVCAAFALSACSDPCVDPCEEAKECSDASELLKVVDCPALCEEMQKQAEDKGCADEYDESLSCSADLNVCNPDESKCATEGEKLATCLAK
ncbi:MAG TPA: hypothetical protein DFS52_13885 [Myxococcales bacterium]|nr:hypothetical protein [Myxococcales bacterium]